jgi:pantoate--beta-alanine ligase
MEIINRRQRISSVARKHRRDLKTIGFVPTMGALHEGHLSLVREARQMADIVIVSVFVNPTQFNEKADFDKYPRDITADAALLSEYNVDYVFAPSEDEMYAENFATYVNVEGITETLEGEFRPGHFRGVSTVVTILLNTIRPDFAFFGQKDAQQVAVIKRLATDLGFDSEVVVVPTMREESGLAMSSRNELLTPEQREKAAVIYAGLQSAERMAASGETNSDVLMEEVKRTIVREPDAALEYVAITNPDTFAPIARIGGERALISLAVRFGDIRLIDNIIIESGQ